MGLTEIFAAMGRNKQPRINRQPWPPLARSVPWFSVILATLLPTWIAISSAPVLPPLAFLVFISWRQLRPGLLPIWAGLPLGFIDDLYSGQPLGSAMMLWSAAAIALDYVEARLPWRNFSTEWLLAAGLIASYILVCLLLANLAGGSTALQVVVPQIALSILCYPLVDRLVAWLDRLRLIHFMEIR
ncbi:MAG: rod shape-determining protein MreD [Novosphingobium sp.]|nr:rod shape-determining protein MreD [Novosphingobium sp.]